MHEENSQKVLLSFADDCEANPELVDHAYKETQPEKILDWTTPAGEGDMLMSNQAKGDFCRKCGQKICRCVDYRVGPKKMKGYIQAAPKSLVQPKPAPTLGEGVTRDPTKSDNT